jgi:hypothetical protein
MSAAAEPTTPSSNPLTSALYTNNSYGNTADAMPHLPTTASTPLTTKPPASNSHIFLPPTRFAHKRDGTVVSRRDSKIDLDGSDTQTPAEDAVVDTPYDFFNFDYRAETSQELEWGQLVNPEFRWPTT